MNKKIIITVGVLVLLILGGGGFWYYQKYQKIVALNMDPFAGVMVPSNVDEATRKIYEEKLEGTKKMYQEGPGFWETWVAIGNIKSLFGDYKGALVAYERSVTLQPNNIIAQRNIAELYANQLNDPERAVAHYRVAINNEPTDVQMYIDAARIMYKRLNNSKDAEAMFLQGLGWAKNKREVLGPLANFYQETGNQEKYLETKATLDAKKTL